MLPMDIIAIAYIAVGVVAGLMWLKFNLGGSHH